MATLTLQPATPDWQQASNRVRSFLDDDSPTLGSQFLASTLARQQQLNSGSSSGRYISGGPNSKGDAELRDPRRMASQPQNPAAADNKPASGGAPAGAGPAARPTYSSPFQAGFEGAGSGSGGSGGGGGTTTGGNSPVGAGAGSTAAGTTGVGETQNDWLSNSNSIGSRSTQAVGNVSGNNNTFDNSSGWFNNNSGSIENNWNFASSSGTPDRSGVSSAQGRKEWGPMPDTGVHTSEEPYYRPAGREPAGREPAGRSGGRRMAGDVWGD